jgi:hypothetical protein
VCVCVCVCVCMCDCVHVCMCVHIVIENLILGNHLGKTKYRLIIQVIN